MSACLVNKCFKPKKKSKPTVKHGVAHMQLNEFSSLQMISEPNVDECGVK